MGASSLLLRSVPWLVLLAAAACNGDPDTEDAGLGGSGGTGIATGGSNASDGDESGGLNGGGSAGEGATSAGRAAHEALTEAVERYDTDVPFTLLLGDEEGTYFEASHGASDADTVYESASTSKWVAATVIVHMTEGILDLDARAADVLPWWTDDPDDWRSEITLAHLLSFTSGLQSLGALGDAPCISLPSASFEACVETIYEDASTRTEEPGTAFVYGSSHLQVAGLMAMTATGASSFAELFAAFQADTGLFPSSAFDLPSVDNPRLAGGMHWTARDYMDFLRAVHVPDPLSEDVRAALCADHTPDGQVEILESPVSSNIGEMWHYSFGNWRECPFATWREECLLLNRYSSPGAYGAYPFMDFYDGFHGLLARQGALGTFPEGLEIYEDLEPLILQVVAAEQP